MKLIDLENIKNVIWESNRTIQNYFKECHVDADVNRPTE